jgi:hypothetical protein
MAVEKESRREHNPVKTSGGEAAERAAHLAPPEERTDGQAKQDEVLSVDTGGLKLPEGLRIESEERTQGFFHLEPVVIFILFLALAFIAYITYLISLEPSD